MKTRLLTLLALVVAVALPALFAAEKIIAGPKGGRLLPTEPQAAEFFVTADRKVEITFYDPAGQPVARAGQTVAVTAEAETRTRLEFEPTANGFVSKTALPGGEPYRVVVQIRATPDARPQNFRINLETHICGGCDLAEYACTCGH